MKEKEAIILGTNEQGFKETGEFIGKTFLILLLIAICLVYHILVIPILIIGFLFYRRKK
jgi:hypothetical protein